MLFFFFYSFLVSIDGIIGEWLNSLFFIYMGYGLRNKGFYFFIFIFLL